MIWALTILTVFNLVNSQIDAYRILKNKTIAHGLNFGCYFAVFLMLVVFGKIVPFEKLWPAMLQIFLFAAWAFCNRQIFFDIPLNLRRGLKWYYVSLDKPPKAWLDRQEVKLWGYNGKAGVFVYASILIIATFLIFIL